MFTGGDDVYFGGNGNDFFFGFTGNETFHGDAGTDTLRGLSGNDVLDGGDGIETVDYSGAKQAVQVFLRERGGGGGDAGLDLLDRIENAPARP